MKALHCAVLLLIAVAPACGAEPAAKAKPAATAVAKSGDLRTRLDGEDWPSFLGPTGDSNSSERGLSAPWPEGGPKLVWQQTTGEGYGMPAISRGRLFLFSRDGREGRLDCETSETGKPLWHFSYPSVYEDLYGYDLGPRCAPVVDGDRVYIFGVEGMLHCLEAETGKLIWKLDTQKKFGTIQNFFGVGSTPVIEGDLLIVQIGGSPPEDQNVPPGQLDQVHGNGSGVVAFDKRTGEVKYKLSDELASYSSPKLATIDGRRWAFVFARGGLLGFEPKTGKLDFHFPWRAQVLESVNASNPVVVDDLVLISECYGPGAALLKVKEGGYDVLWSDADQRRSKRLQTHWNTPVYHDGYIYANSGRHTPEAELRCLELKTGKVMWSEPGLARASLLYVDGHLICLTETGELLLLKATPEKFDVVSRVVPKTAPEGVFGSDQLLKYPAWAAPILSHGLLYVRGHGRLACFEVIPPKRT